MARYQLTIDRRTKKGRSVYHFLEDLELIKNNCVVIDERNTFNRTLVYFLVENNIISQHHTPDKITRKVSEAFLKNRTEKGELTDKELFILNSKIAATKYFANKL